MTDIRVKINPNPIIKVKINGAVPGVYKVTENLTLNATNISNKYIDLAHTPLDNTAVGVFPVGGIKQLYTTDFTVITDGSDIKRLNWDGLTLESYLADGDIISIDYIY